MKTKNVRVTCVVPTGIQSSGDPAPTATSCRARDPDKSNAPMQLRPWRPTPYEYEGDTSVNQHMETGGGQGSGPLWFPNLY